MVLGSEIFNVESDEKAGDRCVEGDEGAMVMVWLWSWEMVRRRASMVVSGSGKGFVKLIWDNIGAQALKGVALYKKAP